MRNILYLNIKKINIENFKKELEQSSQYLNTEFKDYEILLTRNKEDLLTDNAVLTIPFKIDFEYLNKLFGLLKGLKEKYKEIKGNIQLDVDMGELK